ncbi:unnamed protein product [Lactuca saligna]|uniref:Uncharacterized protein n=1 Tax=Lactuca saligna TaxID=75948 RepID=A0AA35VTP9_LACSI|nr:unnamed protein product [Lactuca saligna]
MKEDEEHATNTVETLLDGGRCFSKVIRYKWWIQIAMFTMFALSGQSVGAMLGRLYFTKGGNSKWMATLVQTAGFPLMFPFIFLFSPSKTPQEHPEQVARKPSWTTLVILYTTIGTFLAANFFRPRYLCSKAIMKRLEKYRETSISLVLYAQWLLLQGMD